jgi:peptide/nickel transport system ATP-binding protein
MALLEITNLKTYYETLSGTVKAVDDVSFSVEKGESLGLAGESGCGKTTVALSILRILPSNGKILNGKMLFKGQNLVELSKKEMREKIMWKGISLVFQGAMNALNPVYTVGSQIVEAIRLHEPNVSKKEALERAQKLFELVGLDPSRIKNYPFEFSGGMKQRAVIAMALACNPDLVIADEPATALDVIVQAQVLQLIRTLKEKLDISLILITHDLSIIADTCEKIAVMYAGKIVEYGDVVTIFKEPLHPYTQGLIGAFPNLWSQRTRILSIPGSPPDLISPPKGCRFHPRCKFAMEICRVKEPTIYFDKNKGHYVSCHLISKT